MRMLGLNKDHLLLFPFPVQKLATFGGRDKQHRAPFQMLLLLTNIINIDIDIGIDIDIYIYIDIGKE